MKVLKTIINTLLSFILIFMIIGIMLLNLVSNTILNKEYVVSQLDKAEFYSEISTEIETEIYNYTNKLGLPEEIFEDIYTEEMVKSDIDSIINYVYEGTEIVTNEDDIKVNLNNNLNNYIKSKGISLALSSSLKTTIQKYEDTIIEKYTKNINVSNSQINNVKEKLEYVRDICEKVKYIPIIAIIVILVLVILINMKSIVSILNIVSISVLIPGILFKITPVVIEKSIDINSLLNASTQITNLINTIMRDILSTISGYGNIFIIVGIIGIIINIVIKWKERNN